MRLGLFPSMVGRDAGGPETYEREIIRAVTAAAPELEFHAFCLSEQAERAIGPAAGNLRYHRLRPANRVASMMLGLPLALLRARPAIFHATYVPPPWSPLGYVFTNHCFSNFLHPEFYDPAILRRLNYLVEKGIRQGRMVICVSQHVADLTAARFGVPPERLAVVHHGYGPEFRPVPRAAAQRFMAEQHGVTGRYIAVVGRLDPRKNTLRLIEAFHRLRQDPAFADITLVLRGRRTWAPEQIDATIDRLGLGGAVVELGYADPRELALMYAGAELLLFATLWEGFGMPVVEAMACGTPVVTSNVSALPEVAGDAAILVDPTSVDAIAQGMRRVLSEPGLEAELRQRGLARAQQFSWARAGRETVAAYARALELGPR